MLHAEQGRADLWGDDGRFLEEKGSCAMNDGRCLGEKWPCAMRQWWLCILVKQLNPFSPGGFTACGASAVWVFLTLLLNIQLLCLKLIISASTVDRAIIFCTHYWKRARNTLLDFQSILFIYHLSAVGKRWRKESLRCDYCIFSIKRILKTGCGCVCSRWVLIELQ